jgi:hypothetical protein
MCSVHCHFSQFDCGNLSSLLQIALVPVPVATMDESESGSDAYASSTGKRGQLHQLPQKHYALQSEQKPTTYDRCQ